MPEQSAYAQASEKALRERQNKLSEDVRPPQLLPTSPYAEASEVAIQEQQAQTPETFGSRLGGPRELLGGLQTGGLEYLAGGAGFFADVPGYIGGYLGLHQPMQVGPVQIGGLGHGERYKQWLKEHNLADSEWARQTFMGRVGLAGGEVSAAVGEWALPIIAGVTKGPRVAAESARAIPTLKKLLLDPYRTHKAAALLRDMKAGALWGMGAGIAGELWPEDLWGKGGAELLMGLTMAAAPGSFAGGIASLGRRYLMKPMEKRGPLMRGVAELVEEIPGFKPFGIPSVKEVKGRVQEKYVADALEAAARRFKSASTKSPGEMLEALEAYRDLQAKYPGIALNVPQITGDEAGLGSLMSNLARSPKFRAQLDANRKQTEAVILQELEKAAPNTSAGEQIITKHLQAIRDAEVRALDAWVKDAENRANQEIAAAGAGIVDEGELQKRTAAIIKDEVVPLFRQREKQLYDEIPSVLVETVAIKRAVADHLRSLTAIERNQLKLSSPTNSNIKTIINTIEEYPKHVTFEELRGLRRTLNRAIDQGIQSKDQNVYLLLDLKKGTSDVIRDIMSWHPNPKAMIAYRLADEYAGAGLERLKSSIAGSRVTGLGKYAAQPAESALKQYAHLGSGAERDAAEWHSLLKWVRDTQVPTESGLLRTMEPEARELSQAMEEYLISQAYTSSGIAENKTGVADRLTKWSQSHKAILKHFPEIRMKLSNAEAAQRLFEQRQVAREANIAEYEKSVASDFLSRDVGEAIDAALRPKVRTGVHPAAAVAQLLARAKGHPDVEAGIARALYDRMMQKSFKTRQDFEGSILETFTEELIPSEMIKFLNDNQRILRSYWSPSHIQKINDIANISVRNARRRWMAGKTVPSETLTPEERLDYRAYYRDWVTGASGMLREPTALGRQFGLRFIDYIFETFPSHLVVENLERATLNERHAARLLRYLTPEESRAVTQQYRAPRAIIAPTILGRSPEETQRQERIQQ